MKLKRIELQDFRPFFGAQYLDFSEEATRNVTLVHAQNGQGKTTLLNALLWAFHGVFTGNFQEQDLLLNKEAARQGCVASSTSGQNADGEMRDFDLPRAVCGERSYGQGRTSTIYG